MAQLPTPSKEPKWYALFTKSRSEKKVFERLQEAGIEAYLPLVKTVRQWSDRKKTLHVPLIPSYVFIKLPERDIYKAIMVPGAVNVLKHLGKPAVVREVEIQNMRILSNTDEKLDISNDIHLIKGDTVEVTKGPFMGLIATCEKTGSNYRVVVKIESLGSGFTVNIPLSFLRKIEVKTDE